MDTFDVAIVGAGPAGAAAAITLARLGRRVLLADTRPAARFSVGEGFPPGARPLLAELGLLDRFLREGHRVSFGNVSAWGSAQPHVTDFIQHAGGHGYQLDRRRFDDMLVRGAEEAGVVTRREVRLSLATVGGPSTDVNFSLGLAGVDGNAPCSARALVDAGGRASALSRRLGSKRLRADRLLSFSMLMQARGRTDEDARTLVEAAACGWWYSALLPSHDRIVTYLSDVDLVDSRRLLTTSGFLEKFAEAAWLSGHCRAHGYEPRLAPQASDASRGALDVPAGARWLAVGDAALSFDPLSSHGIANALHTGIAGGLALHASLEGGATAAIDDYVAHLGAIERACQRHHTTTYALETRWPESAFWQRRQSPARERGSAARVSAPSP